MFFRPIAALLLGLAAAGTTWGFGFDDVAAIARREAAAPYREPLAERPAVLPADFAALDYDGLRDIRYRPAKAVWRNAGLPFELQFFHLGGVYRVPIQVHEIDGTVVRDLAPDPAAWDYGRQRLKPAGLDDRLARSPAGFRVHQALNTSAYKDELIVFLGASYFRAVGRGQLYGLSARGLAIDTVGGAAGEEFPRFKAFWIERPAADAKALTIHALLDSPRATGAYRFVVHPGDDTVLDVQLQVFVRAGAVPLASLGIAPLTSMFLHGENQPRAGDFRPEVHDSDGLLLALNDGRGAAGATEWLWRPLVNPRQPLASSFGATQLLGFGLMQRDRRFASYEDSEAHYERRPSAWVEPVGDWGPGRVELLQLPAADETADNIVAYWVPATLPAPGQRLALAYRLHWQGDPAQQPPNGWTVQSRRGNGWGTPLAGELQFIVDFDGPALRALPAQLDAAAVTAVVTGVANARVVAGRAYPHPQGGWRMQLRVQRIDAAQPVELRAFLQNTQNGAQALTETWTALIPSD